MYEQMRENTMSDCPHIPGRVNSVKEASLLIDIKGLDEESTPVKEPLFGIDIVAGDALWFE
jgi:hypothetical protein